MLLNCYLTLQELKNDWISINVFNFKYYKLLAQSHNENSLISFATK